ncbi:hypothetical protein BC332_13363 [Capsicum chinense]|nr:hypothetical protein BC332_13363 [Capsicum chinense]
MRAAVYGDDIAYYTDKLAFFNTYLISAARVRVSPNLYGRPIHTFYWILDKETIVEHINLNNELEKPLPLSTKLNVTALANVAQMTRASSTKIDQVQYNNTIDPSYPQALELLETITQKVKHLVESGKEPNLCNDPFQGEVNDDLRAEDPKSPEEESREPSQELESVSELESLLTGAPIDYLRAYVSDLGDHRALKKLRRILRLLTSLKVVSVLPAPARNPMSFSLLPFGRLKDALKHVFASRIADIKNSPHWNRLSFISCARNGLVLMDESLQLFSAVETLDLSRNKFLPLRKCTKLKHLDLGFNQLRNIASFSRVNIACSS